MLASIGKRHLLVGQPVQAVVVDLRLDRAASAAAGPGREPLFHPRPQSRKAKAASAKPSTSALHVVKLPPGLPTATLEAVVAAALGPDAAFEVRRRSLPLSTAPAGPDGGGGLLPFAFIQLASAADATRVKRALEGSPDVAGVEVCFVARRAFPSPPPSCLPGAKLTSPPAPFSSSRRPQAPLSFTRRPPLSVRSPSPPAPSPPLGLFDDPPPPGTTPLRAHDSPSSALGAVQPTRARASSRPSAKRCPAGQPSIDRAASLRAQNDLASGKQAKGFRTIEQAGEQG